MNGLSSAETKLSIIEGSLAAQEVVEASLEEELEAHIGGGALTPSGIAMEDAQRRYDVHVGQDQLRRQSDEDQQAQHQKERYENARIFQALQTTVLPGVMPDIGLENNPTEPSLDVTISPEQKRVYIFGFPFPFRDDDIVTARRVQATTVWVEHRPKIRLGKGIFDEKKTPRVPYVVVGSKPAESYDATSRHSVEVLLLPLELQTYPSFARGGRLPEGEKDYDQLLAKVKTEIAQVALANQQGEFSDLSSGLTYSGLSYLGLVRAIIEQSELDVLMARELAMVKDFTEQEVRQMYSPDKREAELTGLEDNSARNVRDKFRHISRLWKPAPRPNELFTMSECRPVREGLTDYQLEKYDVLNRLAVVAGLFGKTEEYKTKLKSILLGQ